jgi:hypothetical protein
MITTNASFRRRAGLACLAGVGLTLAGCVVIAVAQATGDVSRDLYAWPLHGQAAIAFALFAALAHLVVLTGMIAFRRSGVIGASRAATAGLGSVILGTGLLVACELATTPLANRSETVAWATVVNSAFGVATVLVTLGMLAVGVAVLRGGTWPSWRRYAPLACGALSLAVIPLQFTSAIWAGVAVYALGYGVLALALLTEPVAKPTASLQAA